MRVLVTGAAGFIGYHTAAALLARGDEVVGLDNLSPYYDVSLKEARLARLTPHGNFSFHKLDLADRAGMEQLFQSVRPQRVVHLGAQAGVRYSIDNPHAYGDSNLTGFLNILEGCRATNVEHLVFASSSSVYGGNTKLPFSTADAVDHPLSLYAATKKANELMAHTYAHLYRLPVTGLRFFTVYGPWGRPDMALFKFTKAMLEGRPIEVYNNGQHARDMTYIDDVTKAVVLALDHLPQPASANSAPLDPAHSSAPYRLYNIGNTQPVELTDMIAHLERALGITAEKIMLPMQPGDVETTYADIDDLERELGARPSTPIAEGIDRFVAWYRSFYGNGGDATTRTAKEKRNI
jgi:UDP-glucuronate 4-epimerase